MLKLQVQNVGEATVVLKDDEGYSNFVMEIPTATTKTAEVTSDVLQRLASKLKAMETPVMGGADGTTVIMALRWSVLAGDADDRGMQEGLAGLPSLNELQAASYSTGAGGTDVVATGTGLLGNQAKASLAIVQGTAQLDLEAVNPGAPGNDISAEVVIGGGVLAISVVGSKVVITTQPAGDTVAAIVAAINAHANAKLLVEASVGAAGSITAAQDEAYLTGGVGPGVSLTLNGTACVLTEVVDGQLTFDIPAGISAASRIVPLEFRNGPHVTRLSVPVVA